MKIIPLKKQIKVQVPLNVEFDKNFDRVHPLLDKFITIDKVIEVPTQINGYFVIIESSLKTVDEDSQLVQSAMQKFYEEELKIDKYIKGKKKLVSPLYNDWQQLIGYYTKHRFQNSINEVESSFENTLLSFDNISFYNDDMPWLKYRNEEMIELKNLVKNYDRVKNIVDKLNFKVDLSTFEKLDQFILYIQKGI